MKVESLPLAESVKQALLRRGIVELFPPQKMAVGAGLLNGENLVVMAPTASGKTLIAVLAAAAHLTGGQGKVLYLTPLRSLASEKYEELSDLFGELNFRVAISVGDYDSRDEWLEKFDVIVTTNEKTDSLIRHRAAWLREVSLVVADEIHLINEARRGPTLELLLSRLRRVLLRAQTLGLSATIRNLEEIATWLEAKPVACDWRPVTLKEGVYYDGEIEFSDGSRREVEGKYGNSVLDLARDTLLERGQALVFTFRRRAAVSLATKAASLTGGALTKSERQELRTLCNQLMERDANLVTEKLVALMAEGAAFHHAGLSAAARQTVERAFRRNLIKVIVATPTLAAGVNLPARRVIIADRYRYDMELGLYEVISAMEYKQMAGRAGRPKYDRVGEAVLIARTLDEVDYLMEEYVRALPERITSKLSSERVLRSQLLAEVASGLASSLDDLRETMSKSLYAMQYHGSHLDRSVESVVRRLVEEGFIELEEGKLRATALGQRVAELYLDPQTANAIIQCVSERKRFSELTYLHMIASTPDMPRLYLRKNEREALDGVVEERGQELALPPPEDLDEYEMYLASLKVALLLLDWIEEVYDNHIYEKYDLGPGDLYALVQTAEWLTYAAAEVSKLIGAIDRYRGLLTLRGRVKHGIKAELLELVSIKGIGRVRARALYSHGFKSLVDIARASERELERVPTIGPTLARQLKEAIGTGELKVKQSELRGLDQYF